MASGSLLPHVPPRTRVLVVHQRPLLLEGVRAVLSAESDFDVIAAAANSGPALLLYRSCRPDVTILGARLADRPATDVVERIRAEFPDCRIALLTGPATEPELRRAARAGARAAVREDASPGELVAVVRMLRDGGRQLPLHARTASHSTSMLTRRERDVLSLIASGHRNRAIAARLGIGQETVKSHIKKIFDKLGVAHRTAAATTAVQEGLLE